MSNDKQQRSIDEQLAEANLLEKKADLKIKLAKLKEIDDAEEHVRLTSAMRESSLKDFNAEQEGVKFNCTNMKGGMDGDGKHYSGDDVKNHCVHINRYP